MTSDPALAWRPTVERENGDDVGSSTSYGGTVIEVEQVSKRFRSTQALASVDLTLD